jgi:hypothetical protein
MRAETGEWGEVGRRGGRGGGGVFVPACVRSFGLGKVRGRHCVRVCLGARVCVCGCVRVHSCACECVWIYLCMGVTSGERAAP